MERILEPELMDDAEQADAYARADFADVNQGFVDRFLQAYDGRTDGRVVDLGCGPADILIRLADRRPQVTLVGVDGAEAMLALGRDSVTARGLNNRIRLVRGTLPGLDLPAHGFDAVISNSLLHHLPEPSVLWRETLRLGRPGAVVLMVDLVRPESTADAEKIVETNAADEHPTLKTDFFNSLLAAFTVAEVRHQLDAAGLPGLTVEPVGDRHLAVQGRLP